MTSFVLAAVLSVCNPTFSPDSSMVAFSRGGDLYVRDVSTEEEIRLTCDGSDVCLNGRASWVYYEEIFGRSSRYRAFWWSPDSKKLAFYRFDESEVGEFPLWSPFGMYGELKLTRYPKAGTANPKVRVCIADLSGLSCREPAALPERNNTIPVIYADFDETSDQYFGTPFWSDDSGYLYVQREPRRQNTLELYRVDITDGHPEKIYSETYPTWLDWLDGMLFGREGLYMVRNFETGWEQIYYLSYDGKILKRLTDGRNWDVSLIGLDEGSGDIWFSAKRDSRIHLTLYRMDRRCRITALTDPDLNVRDIKLEKESFTAKISTAAIPERTVRGSLRKLSLQTVEGPEDAPEDRPEPKVLTIRNDAYDLYALISYPRGFDPEKKYPVLMEVYGGPGTAYVRDYWKNRDASNAWAYENGVIYLVVDPRSSGENGRKGMDEAFGRMTVVELRDYLAWAEYLQSRPYVRADRIGVDGFSFGGTTTAMLVLRYPEHFRCGIAGGGVYDWRLYDSHYTERFMDMPSANPGGYAEASPVNYADKVSPLYIPGALRFTHGTGDDNVHLQNTLLMMDALQKQGVVFDLMLYPDGKHGYRGDQRDHDLKSAAAFWKRWLLDD